MYKLETTQRLGVEEKYLTRLSDNASIPFDPDNTDYQQYLKWVEEGNTPLPADSQPTGENTNEGAA
jgi:hypothetical protein